MKAFRRIGPMTFMTPFLKKGFFVGEAEDKDRVVVCAHAELVDVPGLNYPDIPTSSVRLGHLNGRPIMVVVTAKGTFDYALLMPQTELEDAIKAVEGKLYDNGETR